jgi:hypothetical protein
MPWEEVVDRELDRALDDVDEFVVVNDVPDVLSVYWDDSGDPPETGVFAPSVFVIAFLILGGSCSPNPIPVLPPTASPTVTPVVG